MNDSSGFGTVLKSLLTSRDMKPAQLAAALSVDLSLIKKWLSGSRTPALKSSYFESIRDILVLSPEEDNVLKDAQIYSLDPRKALRNAEERAAECEVQLQTLFDNSLDPILIVDITNAKVLAASAITWTFFRIPEGEIDEIGRAVFVLPDELAVSAYLLQVIHQDRKQFWKRVRLQDGHLIPVEIIIVPFQNQNKQLKSFVIFREVTPFAILDQMSLLSENRALLAEQRLDEIMSCLSDGFFVLDAYDTITFANKALLSNPYAADFVGKNILRDFPKVEAFHNCLQKVKEERISQRCTEIVPLVNKKIELNVHPLSDGGMAVYVRNVTE